MRKKNAYALLPCSNAYEHVSFFGGGDGAAEMEC